MTVALVHPREERKQLAHLAPVDAQAKLIEMWLYGKADTTKAIYRNYVTRFSAFIAKPLRMVTVEDLYDFAAYLDGQEYADSSQKTILYVIKSLLSFAHKLEMVPVNVGAGLAIAEVTNDYELKFEIYRTAKGFRLLEMSRLWNATTAESSVILERMGSDRLYSTRISSKPTNKNL